MINPKMRLYLEGIAKVPNNDKQMKTFRWALRILERNHITEHEIGILKNMGFKA